MADIHSTLSESLRAQAAHYEEIPDDEQEKAPGWPRIRADATPERVADNSSFPFLKLPAELRNKIYGLTVTRRLPIAISRPRFFEVRSMLALLSVCRQIRDEAREMFYAGNRFLFYVREDKITSNRAVLWLFLKNTTNLSATHTLVRDLKVYVVYDRRRNEVMAKLKSLRQRHFPSSRPDAKMDIKG